MDSRGSKPGSRNLFKHPTAQLDLSAEDGPMFGKLRRTWQQFKTGQPGERFKQRYYARQKSQRGPLRKIALIGAGIVILVVGIFFIPAPGPGFLIVFLGAGLIAGESLPAARALDWTELTLRAAYARLTGIWSGARSRAVKWTLIVILGAFAVAIAFAAYWLVSRRLLGDD
jgi:uncharacterized protein (TIGR02611 family)